MWWTPDESKLPKWIKVSKQKFDVIKKKVQNTKNNNLQARPSRGRFVASSEWNKLLQDIEYGKITLLELEEELLELEEESAAERRNQQGKGLKILTPDQMLSRLPINLVQLKAGNNSQKLINEIRQLLYSLYRSKKLTKEIYNHLINAI